MGLRCKLLAVLALGPALLAGYSLTPVSADDHDHRKTRYKISHTAPKNRLYSDRCGGCHLPYPPGLLPADSWRKILATQSDHFGEDLTPGQAEQQELASYLETNAADRSNAKLSRKIMRSLNGATPVRITQIPYIIHKHEDDDVPEGAFRRKSVGSFANCGACHPSAAAGDFHDDDVRIPTE